MATAQESFEALEVADQLGIAGAVFTILEFDSEGNPGSEWSSDTTQALGELFERYGVTFTDPNEEATS